MYERDSGGPLAGGRAAVMDGLGAGFPAALGLLELCVTLELCREPHSQRHTSVWEGIQLSNTSAEGRADAVGDSRHTGTS